MSSLETPVLALDGPSAVGKGTVARLVSNRLHWHLLDSGAVYRALGLLAARAGVVTDDIEALIDIAHTMAVAFRVDELGIPRVLVDCDDVTEAIRSEACGKRASQVASSPAVRRALLQCQRAFRRPPGLVADGRDMGTVVFPDAIVKVYLTASVEERASRRYKQLMEQGLNGSLKALSTEIKARDERDCTRAVSPLMPASDAVILDTTRKSVEGVVEAVLSHMRQRVGLVL